VKVKAAVILLMYCRGPLFGVALFMLYVFFCYAAKVTQSMVDVNGNAQNYGGGIQVGI
jgi:hypothetical protein